MILKMFQIVDMSHFYQRVKKLRLPIKTAHELSKLAAAVDKELEFYQEEFNKIMSEYAQKDAKGGYIFTDETKQAIKVEKGKEKECEDKLKELMNLDINMNIELKLKIEDFGAIEITIEELLPILPFIQE